MKEHPILFSAPMVSAILAGTKTQTRRICKFGMDDEGLPAYAACRAAKSGWISWFGRQDPNIEDFTKRAYDHGFKCPYGEVGDCLWVRESFYAESRETIHYRADGWGYSDCPNSGWKPSIFMPRWASRATLEIVEVRVERLTEISEDDAKAEGVSGKWCDPVLGRLGHWSYRKSYADLWDTINGHGSWDLNPWVWVVIFRKAVV